MGILYAWAVKLSSWITILVTFALLLLPAEGHVGLWVGLFAVDVYLVFTSLFFTLLFHLQIRLKLMKKCSQVTVKQL